MSFEVYRIVHIVSIVVFFSMFAAAAYSKQSTLTNKIVTGISLFFILFGGMGLKTYAAPGPWPTWLLIKSGIWGFVGVAGHASIKRFPNQAKIVFWVCVGLLTVAAYLVNYRI